MRQPSKTSLLLLLYSSPRFRVVASCKRIALAALLDLNEVLALARERRLAIIRIGHGFRVVGCLTRDSIAVDAGTGHDASFSCELIRLFGLRCYGLEPTRKHHLELKKISNRFDGKLVMLDGALGPCLGKAVFFESLKEESGSLLQDHANIIGGQSRSYEVETVDMPSLFNVINTDYIDVLKLDVEGEEYSVLMSAPDYVLRKIGQIAVEFHHNCVKRYNIGHTAAVISRLERVGFKSFTTDYVNFLFYRPFECRMKGS